MSNSKDSTLSTCGCCQGLRPLTPQSLQNLPGLSTLVYRIGTHGSFKATMLANLTESRGLGNLTSRDDDDPSIALLDASAAMLDVLTFYQERIINEGYLRTALERRSILDLARQIGYELAPGVAASTYLAFTLESAAGAPDKVTIPIGTRVQSLPEQDQIPQSFETVEAITAQAAWNKMTPKTTELVQPGFNDDEIYLKGIATNLKVGDALLIVGQERIKDSGNENWDFRRIKSVTTMPATDPEQSYTLVSLEYGLGSFEPFKMPALDEPRVYALRQRANLFGYNAPDWRGLTKKVRQDYLGLESESELKDYPDWPDLNIAAVSDGTGLYGEYFDDSPYTGQHFKRRILGRTDPQINFFWGEGSPASGVGADNFSVRWTGWILPKVSGTHSFFVKSDDGVCLRVNGKLIINQWKDQAATEWAGSIDLEASRPYEIKLEYYEHSGWSEIRLWWEVGDKLQRELVPDTQLYPRDIYTVHMDAVYPQVRPGGWAVLSRSEYQEAYQIEDAVEDARARFTMSGKSTRLMLKGENLFEKFNNWLRQTVVFCQSEELTWAERPITQPLRGDMIILEKRITGLLPKRTLIVSGRRSRVKAIGGGLKLHVTDSSQDVKLEKNETLLVLQAPLPLENAKYSWLLQNHAGLVGTAEASESKLAFQPSESGDTPVSEVVTVKKASEDKHAKIQVAHSGLELQLENSSYKVALKKNVVLSLLQPPVSLGDGKFRWHVQTSANRTGTVETSEDEFIFLSPERDHTEIELEQPLTYIYDLATAVVYGNVAQSTHGETKREVLGSGDASQPFQKFILKNKPLTYVSAANPAGAETTLQVRANGILWEEADSLYILKAREHSYITRRDDDGTVTVEFGDGKTGARLSSGNENVSAVYRVGTGADGMVKAGQLSLLMTQILGVQKVNNPLAPTGAADPESRDQARQNAPFTVMTLGRVVSLQDFEDFARAFAGIGKAQAEWLWDGEARVVHLTIAASTACGGDYRVISTSKLYKNLRAGIDAARDTTQRLLIDTYAPLFFRLKVRLVVNPDYLPDKVVITVNSALKAAYSFSKRLFGQSVSRSEILALIQGIEGVDAAFLDALYATGQAVSQADLLVAHRARQERNHVQPAELLLIDPTGISVEAIKS